MKLTYREYIGIALILAVIGVLGVLWQKPWQVVGSVAVGNQYQSTTTPQVADGTNLCPARSGMASSTTGILGTVNVLGTGTGELLILDATTTDVTRRIGNIATSSLILAWYPVGFGTTTNEFDIEFKRGLLIDYTTGVATSTISYRCEG